MYNSNENGERIYNIIHRFHIVLYKLGFTPIFERSFPNNTIPPACSAEWQAKALCGEIMMSYEKTQNMTADEIVDKYKVSIQSAKIKLKY